MNFDVDYLCLKIKIQKHILIKRKICHLIQAQNRQIIVKEQKIKKLII